MFPRNVIPAYFFNRYWERKRKAELLSQHAQLMNKYNTKATIKHSYYKQSHMIKDFHWAWNETNAEAMLISILKQDRVLSTMNIVPFTKGIKDEDNYFAIEGLSGNAHDVVIKFRILESVETASSILRINWLMSVFNALPYVWYDENGDPYLLSYGRAAIRVF